MLSPLLSPSMMCIDYARFGETLSLFADLCVEYLHVDVMDGVFVKNYTLGTDFCRQLRRMSSIPLDIHLMITEPEWKIAWFDVQPGEFVSVHAEATDHLERALAAIRQMGGRPMAALNPATPLCVLDYVLDDIDAVLLMTVNPGFAGQKLIPATLGKIADCRRYLDERGYPDIRIEVDGNVSFENAVKMRETGADLFVCGSSSIFCGDDLRGNIRKLREGFAV
ncbi:MAG: ribulose-phosphate 3-epimerase [Clostridiales bacterium]|nr:ribulose-phosphate 3-epimerase [Clostridiales bacterium]